MSDLDLDLVGAFFKPLDLEETSAAIAEVLRRLAAPGIDALDLGPARDRVYLKTHAPLLWAALAEQAQNKWGRGIVVRGVALHYDGPGPYVGTLPGALAGLLREHAQTSRQDSGICQAGILTARRICSLHHISWLGSAPRSIVLENLGDLLEPSRSVWAALAFQWSGPCGLSVDEIEGAWDWLSGDPVLQDVQAVFALGVWDVLRTSRRARARYLFARKASYLYRFVTASYQLSQDDLAWAADRLSESAADLYAYPDDIYWSLSGLLRIAAQRPREEASERALAHLRFLRGLDLRSRTAPKYDLLGVWREVDRLDRIDRA
jgi:hypothetical protein